MSSSQSSVLIAIVSLLTLAPCLVVYADATQRASARDFAAAITRARVRLREHESVLEHCRKEGRKGTSSAYTKMNAGQNEIKSGYMTLLSLPFKALSGRQTRGWGYNE